MAADKSNDLLVADPCGKDLFKISNVIDSLFAAVLQPCQGVHHFVRDGYAIEGRSRVFPNPFVMVSRQIVDLGAVLGFSQDRLTIRSLISSQYQLFFNFQRTMISPAR